MLHKKFYDIIRLIGTIIQVKCFRKVRNDGKPSRYVLKKTGPWTLPWGPPLIALRQSYISSLILHLIMIEKQRCYCYNSAKITKEIFTDTGAHSHQSTWIITSNSHLTHVGVSESLPFLHSPIYLSPQLLVSKRAPTRNWSIFFYCPRKRVPF